MNLRDDLTAEYMIPNLPIEREHFKPHVTVARLKNVAHVDESRLESLKKNKNIQGRSFECSEIKLFKSPAGPDGYEILGTFPLKGVCIATVF